MPIRPNFVCRLVLLSNFARDPWRRSLTPLPGAKANGECALTRKRQMPTARKAVKERNCTQMPVTKKARKNRPRMPVAKKERTNYKWWWQTKNGCPNQASEHWADTKRKKQNSWTHLKTPKGGQPASLRWYTHTHTHTHTHTYTRARARIKNEIITVLLCTKWVDEYSQSHASTEA